MSQFVSEIISIGGASLEKEDQFLQSFGKRRGQVGGVLSVKQPCWQQYVFGRAIVPKYDSDLQFDNDERCFGELQVKFERKKYFFRMESWKEGESLAQLTDGVATLAKNPTGAWLLVFSANPCGETEARLQLIDGLSGVGTRASVHRFGTKTAEGEDYEFWVGGWPVASKRSIATGRSATA